MCVFGGLHQLLLQTFNLPLLALNLESLPLELLQDGFLCFSRLFFLSFQLPLQKFKILREPHRQREQLKRKVVHFLLVQRKLLKLKFEFFK